MNENYPTHKETFDVKLLKRGVSSMTCETKDIKTLTITATDTLAAQMSDEVVKEKDFVCVGAVPPGHQMDFEIHARRRELDSGSSACRVCLNIPCTCKK